MSSSIRNFEDEVLSNSDFRRILFSGKTDLQIIAQNLSENERIPFEEHDSANQIFLIMTGSGFINTQRKVHQVFKGSLVVIEKGTKHEVVAGDRGMKFLTIYTALVH